MIQQRKISGNCQQFSLVQCINEPTPFTDTSCSLIDLVLVSNRNSIISCCVGDPFLHQNIRFHCPVCGILNFFKPKSVSVVRHIWSYDQSDYDLLREKAFTTNWNSLQHINNYADNITDKIMERTFMLMAGRLPKEQIQH